jgi:hypothetical protein
MDESSPATPDGLPTAPAKQALESALEQCNPFMVKRSLRHYLNDVAKTVLAIPTERGVNPVFMRKEIEDFTPYVHEFSALLYDTAEYSAITDNQLSDVLVEFFDQCLTSDDQHKQRHELDSSHIATAAEHVNICTSRLFLYATAVLRKAKRIDCLKYLTSYLYAHKTSYSPPSMKNWDFFTVVATFLSTKDSDGAKIYGVLLKEKHQGSILTWSELCETELLLFLRSGFMNDNGISTYHPATRQFWNEHDVQFTTFLRGQSIRVFQPTLDFLGYNAETFKERWKGLKIENNDPYPTGKFGSNALCSKS